jgi:flagellum-specific ATP synthase
MIALESWRAAAERISPWPRHGLVERVTGLVVEGRGPRGALGESCWIGDESLLLEAEIIGFRGSRTLLMPLGQLTGVRPGQLIRLRPDPPRVPTGDLLVGRVLDAMGEPIDGKGPLAVSGRAPLHRAAPPALERPRINQVFSTGVRSIDGLLTCGRGQRLGIFAGAGVGKSVLLGMIARCSDAQVNVIGLIGERGREVREFIERDLGEEGLAKSVVVVVTSDQAPLLKRRGVQLATAIAESFRERGRDVLLMVDSLTRVAMAQREIGLAAGEPPASKGYTPSVFALLPGLLERAGRTPEGSITGFYTVLVEGDDLTDPVADASRSILDGHLVLSRRLAERGHWPAVDVLTSISRVRPDLVEEPHDEAVRRVLRWLAAHQEAEDLIQVGAYVKGTDPDVDQALARLPRIREWLCQRMTEHTSYAETVKRLRELAA